MMIIAKKELSNFIRDRIAELNESSHYYLRYNEEAIYNENQEVLFKVFHDVKKNKLFFIRVYFDNIDTDAMKIYRIDISAPTNGIDRESEIISTTSDKDVDDGFLISIHNALKTFEKSF